MKTKITIKNQYKMNRNEQKYYSDIGRIADSLQQIAKSLYETRKGKPPIGGMFVCEVCAEASHLCECKEGPMDERGLTYPRP